MYIIILRAVSKYIKFPQGTKIKRKLRKKGKMIESLKTNSTIIAITNDGPKGPPREAKLGSYKIALQSNAQIITISSTSTKFWEVNSWDKLRIPKPFGTVYINISKPLNTNEDYKKIKDAKTLSQYLNDNLNELDETI